MSTEKSKNGAGKGPVIPGFKQGQAWRKGCEAAKIGTVQPQLARRFKITYGTYKR